MKHCENYPCKLNSGCVCKCDSCKDTFDIKYDIEELKKFVEQYKKNNNETYCPHCGKAYIEPMPYIPWSPQPLPNTIPYTPGTPIWQYPNWTISNGTVAGGGGKELEFNTFPPNWINGDGGSTI